MKDLAASRQRGRDEHRRNDRDQAGPGGAGLGFQEQQHAVTTIFGGASAPLSRSRAKLLWREVYAASPAPGGSQPLKWSSTPVTFDRSNHTSNMWGHSESLTYGSGCQILKVMPIETQILKFLHL